MTEKEIEFFTSFQYPEYKELLMTFLTLASTVFTASLVFAERFVIAGERLSARQAPILLAWAFLLAAVGAAGFSLFKLFIAAELVFGGAAAVYDAGYRSLMDSMRNFADIGGVCFGLGLAALGSAALTKILRRSGAPSVSPPEKAEA